MKKILPTVLYLLMPSILVFALEYVDSSSYLFWRFVLIIYLITVVGLIFYFKLRPCNFLVLLIGLLMSPSLVFICEHIENSEFFPYLLTSLSIFYYALPFALISIIIFIVLKIKAGE